MYSKAYGIAFWGILRREAQRFIHQRSRFFSALIRPLLWLLVFAAGFRSVLGIAILPPYETYITYEQYITPGLMAMIVLFNGMQSSLSMVYDREMGSMRVLLMSPVSRGFLLLAKVLASALVALPQIYVFLVVAWFLGIEVEWLGYIFIMPVLLLTGVMIASLGLILASLIKQLENFAGVMNFVVFPMFFMSSALYPLWRMREANEWLYWVCAYNPFTHAVELIRFALYSKMNWQAFWIVICVCGVLCLTAVICFDPQRGLMRRQMKP